ncbi:ARID DNA-binding domain-containing protein [Tanacetum coccineum]
MIKGTDHGTWDDIWYISNHTDKHLCYKQDFFCNIKEAFTVNKLENQKKFLFTYGIGEVIIEDGGQGCLVPGVYYAPEVTLNILSMDLLEKQDDIVNQEWDIFRNRFNKVVKWFYNYYLDRSLPGPIPPTINGVQIHLFDLYKLVEGLGGYLSVHFCQEFDTIGEILGLSKGNGEEIKRCYMKLFFNNATREIERKVEGKDRDCLMSHQWDFSETGAPTGRIAVQKGKGKVEHFGVKLEDTEEGEDSQEQPTLSHSTRTQNLQGMVLGPPTSRMTSNEDSGSNTSDDFTIIT